MNDLLILITAKLNESGSIANINSQLKELAKNLHVLELDVKINNVRNVENAIKNLQREASNQLKFNFDVDTKDFDDLPEVINTANARLERHRKIWREVAGEEAKAVNLIREYTLANGKRYRIQQNKKVDGDGNLIGKESTIQEMDTNLEKQRQASDRFFDKFEKSRLKAREKFNDDERRDAEKQAKAINKLTEKEGMQRLRDTEKLQEALANVRKQSSEDELADENKRAKLAQEAKVRMWQEEQKRGTKLGTFDNLSKGKATEEELGKTLKLIDAYKDREIREVRLNEVTGEWNAKIKENGKQNRVLKGVIDKSTGSLYRQSSALELVRNRHQGFGEQLKTALQRVPVWMVAMTAFWGTLRSFQAGVQSIIEIDTAITNLRKVADGTAETFKNFALEANNIGNKLGATTVDVIKATTEFARLGYTLNESKVLAQESLLYSNVGDMNIEDASQSIISTIKGFRIQVDSEGANIRKALDVFNEVGNNFAISSAGIGEALRRSSSSLYEAGNTLEQSVAMITSANAVVQDPATVGTALKTVTMRLRGMDEEGEKVAGLVPLLEADFAKFGLSLKKSDNSFKSTYEIFDGLAEVWGRLSDFDKANLLEKIAGKRQGNIVASMLSNWKDARSALETGLSSTGSATKEFEKYMDSFEYRMNQFKNAITGFWQVNIDSENLKAGISTATSLVNAFASLTKQIGLIPPVIGLLSAGFLAFTTSGRSAVVWSSDLIKSLWGMATGAEGATVAFRGLTVSINMANLTTKAFQVTIGIFMTLGIVALTMALGALIQKVMEYNQKQKEIEKQNQDTVKSYNANQQEIDGLIDKYKALSSNQSKSTDEQQEFQDIQNRLNKLMPILTDKIDEQGNAHLRTVDAVEKEIGYIKELQRNYDELNLEQFNTKIDDTFDKIEDMRDSMADLQDRMEFKFGEGDMPLNNEQMILAQRQLITDRRELELFNNQIGQMINEKAQAYLRVRDVLKNLTEEDKKYIEAQIQKQAVNVQDKNDANALADQYATLAEAVVKINKTLNANLKVSDFAGLDTTQLEAVQQLAIIIAKEGTDAWKNHLDIINKNKISLNMIKLIVDSVNSALGKTPEATASSAMSLSQLIAEYNNASDEISVYNDLLQANAKGEKISADEMVQHAEKYPQLFNAYKIENGLVVLNEQAVRNLIKTRQDGLTENIAIAKADLETQKTALIQKLHLNELEIKGIQSVADARKNLAKMMNDRVKDLGIDSGLAMFVESFTTDLEAYGQIAEDLNAIGNLKGSVKGIGVSSKDLNDKGDKDKEKQKKDLLDTTEAYISQNNAKAEELKKTEELLKKQRDVADEQKDYNKELALTRQLIANNKKQIEELKKANEELHKKAQAIRNAYDSKNKNATANWFNADGSKSQEYLEAYNKLTIKWNNATEKQRPAIEAQMKKMDDTWESLSKLGQAWRDNADAIAENSDEIQKNTGYLDDVVRKQIDAYNAWKEEVKEIADEVVETMKEAYEKQKEIAVAEIDEELEALEKSHERKLEMLDEELEKATGVIDEKLKLLDKEADAEDYNASLKKAQDDRQALVDKIAVLSLDDSEEAKSELEDLYGQLDDIDAEIAKMKQDRDRELRRANLEDEKEVLQEQVDAKKDAEDEKYETEKERLEKEKTDIEWFYDELINDEQKWADMRSDIANGYIDKVQDKMKVVLTDFQTMNESVAKKLGISYAGILSMIKEIQSASGNLDGIDYDYGTQDGENPWGVPQSVLDDYYNNKLIWYDKNSTQKEKSDAHEDNEDIRDKYPELKKDDPTLEELLPHVSRFDTGGLTGDWLGEKGKLAILDKKELVLNQQDSENFLSAIRLLREIFSGGIGKIKPITPPPSPSITYNLELNVGSVTGDKNGADYIFKHIVKEIKKTGGKL